MVCFTVDNEEFDPKNPGKKVIAFEKAQQI